MNMVITAPVLTAKEIKDRSSRCIVIKKHAHMHCCGEDRAACAHCGAVSDISLCFCSNAHFHVQN